MPPPKACRTGSSRTTSGSTSRRRRDIGSFVADEQRIRQILFNLLANAVGFSPPGETVVLTALRAAESVIFAVSDHGPGHSDRKKG